MAGELLAIPDADMDRSYDRGSDFKIVSKDPAESDTALRMIKISRMYRVEDSLN